MNMIDEWVKTCLHKNKYTEEEADWIIKKKKKDIRLYKYYCPHCFGWHLTKKKPFKNH